MKSELDIHCQMILEEYDENLPVFEKIKEIVTSNIKKVIADNKIYLNAIEARIKSRDSLAGKLEIKGQKYKTMSDITDILGARIITFYSDEVDKVSVLVDNLFEVDWESSVDKRKIIELDKFGYMSLHYICRIPKSLYYDPQCPKINELRFEIQMRTALQHVWATMYHDTGYKSGIEIPKEYLRNLNRLAGMLELADEHFSTIRKDITDYRRKVQALVASGNIDEVPLNGDTFRSYLEMKPFQKLIDKIASINQAEVYEDNIMKFLPVLLAMGLKTLGDVDNLIKDCSDGAYQLALHRISTTDLDILTLSVAVMTLCAVYNYKKGATVNDYKRYYEAIYGESEYNLIHSQKIYELLSKLNIL